MKWLRRARQAESQPDDRQLWLFDLSRAPHRTSRKVFFGAIHAVLTLQKKYGYAGAFRIKGYLEQDYHIYLSETTIRKIMAINRRLHLAPRRPIKVEEPREIREGPKKSRWPFEYLFVDFRYLDAKPGGVQLYSTLLLEGFSRTILDGPPAQYYVFCVVWLYHSSRTHLSLCKDAPEPRAKQAPECGPVFEIAEVGGLHHCYERRAA